MIVMNLRMDNLYGFEDFEINFSYPKKIVNSTIPMEFLEEKPNFRFKRVNIIMGANASGKTTLGKAIMEIFNWIGRKSFHHISEYVSNKKTKSFFEIDFVLDGIKLYRIYYEFLGKKAIKFEFKEVYIRKADSYEKAKERLITVFSTKDLNSNQDLENEINKSLDLFEGQFGWLFSFPNDDLSENSLFNLKILNGILKTFDTSIQKVIKGKDAENTYVIVFKDGKRLILQDGEVINKNILSSGTHEAISIASVLSKMKKSPQRPFYIDEKFSHAQTDLEEEILNLMIGMISKKSQLFFTTHNTEILELNLPVHSFTFLKKTDKIEVVYPSELIKRNDVSLVNAVKNDVFRTLPDTDGLYELGECCL